MKKDKNSDIKYKLSLWWLFGCLAIGLAISYLLLAVLSGSIYPEITDSSPLQVCVIIIGGIPTIYLWVINQRKKEKEQLNATRRSLQERYVEAIKQFYDDESFIAGAYALRGLIDDWYHLDIDIETKQTQMNQLAIILFSKNNKPADGQQEDDARKMYMGPLVDVLANSLHRNDIKYSIKLIKIKELNFQEFNFAKIDLSGADLSNADLNSADLSNANLSHANLSHTDLSGAIIISADLSNANLNSADLSDANLFGIEGSDAYFDNANLRRANLKHADIKYSYLSDACLEYTSLRFANLNSADLSNTKLKETDFINANLSFSNFCNADLTEAIITDDQLASILDH